MVRGVRYWSKYLTEEGSSVRYRSDSAGVWRECKTVSHSSARVDKAESGVGVHPAHTFHITQETLKLPCNIE